MTARASHHEPFNGASEPRTLPPIRGLEKTSYEFRRALVAMADRLGLIPEYIAAVISVETGGTFSPAIRNLAGSGAVGLIQFLPKTAIALDTDRAALEKMTDVEQLYFVEKYFRRANLARIRRSEPGDYYMAVFMPYHVGRPGTAVLATKGSIVYAQNRGLDKNGDGVITVGDVWETVERVVREANSYWSGPPLMVDPPADEEPTDLDIPIVVEEPTTPATPAAIFPNRPVAPTKPLVFDDSELKPVRVPFADGGTLIVPPPPALPTFEDDARSSLPPRAATNVAVGLAAGLSLAGLLAAIFELLSR